MRRGTQAVLAATVLVGATLMGGAPAVAAPTPAPTLPVPSPVPGQAVCSVDDELSAIVGLVATAKGYAVAVRSNDAGLNVKVYPLTSSCKLTGTTVPYSGNPNGGPIDPEDLALSSDGADYWVADTGDDLAHPKRDHVAIWKLPVNRDRGTIYRFTYPDGPHDAEALLLSGDGTPILVTRVVSGPAGIYAPAAALDPSGAEVPLKKVGEFMPQKTGTANLLGTGGQLSVTGAAVSPDGKRVVLRTVSDAYEWDVTGGDIVKAITTGTPRITPLGDAGMGRAITYSLDSASFLTVPDASSDTPVKIMKYAPAVAPPPGKAAGGSAAGGKSGTDGKSWLATVSLRQLTLIVFGVGAAGLLMVIGGILGMKYGRRRPAKTPPVKNQRQGNDTGRADRSAFGQGQQGHGQATRYPQQGGDPYRPGFDDDDPYQPDRRGASPHADQAGGRVYGGRPSPQGTPYGRPVPERRGGSTYGQPSWGDEADEPDDWPPAPRGGGWGPDERREPRQSYGGYPDDYDRFGDPR